MQCKLTGKTYIYNHFRGYMKVLQTILSLILLLQFPGYPQSVIKPESYTYKTIDTVALNLQVYYPKRIKRNKKIPAVIFFFGGGWVSGNTGQFKPHCEYLAQQGMAGITAEYRIKNKHNTTPQDAIADAKSAMRWLKANADKLNLDKNRIIAAGGSAGGHLAACTATLDAFNDPSDDLNIDPKPDGLILFNPVLNTAGFMDRFGGEKEVKESSPIFHISETTPPTLIFHGTEDTVEPASTILEFQKIMIGKENTCEVILFGGEKHAFFNKGKKNDRPFHQTLVLMKQFLIDEGYLVE
jgi:acetyl esterase/lipase